MSLNQSDAPDRREVSRRALFGVGLGAVSGAAFAAAQANGLMADDEALASGNFVAGEVVSSADGVLEIERVDTRERISVVVGGETRLPDPTLATAKRGRTVGINAPGIAHVPANAKVQATVVAPCVLGQLSDAKKRQDVPR